MNILSIIKVNTITLVICVSMLYGAWSLPSIVPLNFGLSSYLGVLSLSIVHYLIVPTSMEILKCDRVMVFLLVNPTYLHNCKNHGLLAQ